MHSFYSLTFYITGAPGQIAPGHPLWDHPLAGRSSEFSGRTGIREANWTVGDYFLAAEFFISTPEVLAAITDTPGLGTSSPGDWDITLDLQKHGAFYHPIKMTLSLPGKGGVKSFVLNGGVSPQGRELARKEAGLFSWLADRLSDPVTPGVVAAGEVGTGPGIAGFFMARWLEGYYEFHITRDGEQVAVWRPGENTLYLPLADALPAYENIARILTLAYEPHSGAQVLLWHHAAGDFIMAPDLPGLPVKLITVRSCGSLIDEELLAEGPMPGLLFFFVNLCLRMQMDRFDGVGEPVFLGRRVLSATLSGFLKGLAHRAGDQGAAAVQGVWEFLSSFPAEQIELVLDQVTKKWPPGPAERDLMTPQKTFFVRQIRELLKSGRACDFY